MSIPTSPHYIECETKTTAIPSLLFCTEQEETFEEPALPGSPYQAHLTAHIILLSLKRVRAVRHPCRSEPVVPIHSETSRAYGAVLVSPVPVPGDVEPLMPLEEFREVLPPIEPGEGLGDALLPNGALLPPALNPALVSEPLPKGAEVAPEDVDAAPAAVPSVPAAGALTEPDALEPAPTLVPPVPPDCANAAGTKAASGNANDELSVNAISDFFIVITCSSPLLYGI